MFVFHKKGIKPHGKNPMMLTGYGGFNVSLTPCSPGARYLWLEHWPAPAPVLSEFGEDWHRAACWTSKRMFLTTSSPPPNS